MGMIQLDTGMDKILLGMTYRDWGEYGTTYGTRHICIMKVIGIIQLHMQ
jgi:hypothetical protein